MSGQIIPRGKDTWLVRVFIGRDENGKRKYHNKTIHGGKKVAQKYLNDMLREKDAGTLEEPTKMTINEYLDRWLETSAKGRVRPQTYEGYKRELRLYIRPQLGEYKLSKLNALTIQSVYKQYQEERGLAPATIRRAHVIFSSAMNQAVKWGMISKNPCEHVDLPRKERKEMNVFTPEEARIFLEAAVYDRWHALYVLLLTTGMRPGEALGLKWGDIKDGKIRIQRTLIRRGAGWRLDEPKTSRSRRTIPLPGTAVDVLKEHKLRQTEQRFKAGENYHNHDFVFAVENGEPINLSNLTNHSFKPLLKGAGLKNIRLYDLRHTCATLLLAAGENPKVVSERLGHESITLTLDTYSHVLPDMQKKAAEKLENMLFG
ncbi:tyrosine-type recombinase/integrase [Aneurinibacillus aneurinilyticus]|uniref:tyrosine-type recombinase/integrase n=1 Tax=Aneurinibacillus aneurinilyticus TaxID=1391 RepID=UPI0036719C4B